MDEINLHKYYVPSKVGIGAILELRGCSELEFGLTERPARVNRLITRIPAGS